MPSSQLTVGLQGGHARAGGASKSMSARAFKRPRWCEGLMLACTRNLHRRRRERSGYLAQAHPDGREHANHGGRNEQIACLRAHLIDEHVTTQRLLICPAQALLFRTDAIVLPLATHYYRESAAMPISDLICSATTHHFDRLL